MQSRSPITDPSDEGSVKKKTPLETFLAQKPSPPQVEYSGSNGSESPKPIESEEVDGSWTCPKCQTVIVPGDDVVEDRERWLTAARQEHDDYHALSLGGGPATKHK
jgi:hypothetical protein